MQPFESAKRIGLDLLFPSLCVSCEKEGMPLCAVCERLRARTLPACIVCKKVSPERADNPAGTTCPACRKKTDVKRFLSPWSYDSGVIQAVVHSLKYKRVTSLAPLMAKDIVEDLARFAVHIPKEAALVPVPLYWRRERVRGFNQSELIAQEIGRLIHIPVPSLLRRIKKTAPQTSLSHTERKENMKEAFAAAENTLSLAILVDDVKTTGSTLSEAASTLKKAGTKNIWAFTYAH